MIYRERVLSSYSNDVQQMQCLADTAFVIFNWTQ